eukprot:2505049-Pleurochrysis_carterae.AAC.1
MLLQLARAVAHDAQLGEHACWHQQGRRVQRGAQHPRRVADDNEAPALVEGTLPRWELVPEQLPESPQWRKLPQRNA